MTTSLADQSAIDDVFITEQLPLRPRRKADHLQEKLALQDLALLMADDPGAVLPRFVDLAMEMTGGISAGLSLYEPDPAPGVFRWCHLRGELEPFNGATTPRDYSPCGVTLDRREPVLSLHPERYYRWISEAGIVVPEVLLVPLYLGGDEPLGTLWIVAEQEGWFDLQDSRALTDLASFVGIALRMQRAEKKLQRALEDQETLTREMSHRLKNVFALTDGMIRFTAKGAGSTQEMAEILSGRLHALARAHSLVRRSFTESDFGPVGSDLAALLRAIVDPHETMSGHANSRFKFTGPSVPCGQHATSSIALLIHELATNAAKYGALKSDTGSVDVAWSTHGEMLALRWAEIDGPKIEAPPSQKGFGSTLVENTVRQLGGEIQFDWQVDGLVVVLHLPVKSLSH